MQSSITHFKAWKKGKVWLYSASLITFLLLGAVTTQLAKADESTASPLTSLNSLTPNSLDASACSSNSETSEISTVSSVISSTPQISESSNSTSTPSISSLSTSQSSDMPTSQALDSSIALSSSSSISSSSTTVDTLDATTSASNSNISSLAATQSSLADSSVRDSSSSNTIANDISITNPDTTLLNQTSNSGISATDQTTLANTTTLDFYNIAGDALSVGQAYSQVANPGFNSLKTGDILTVHLNGQSTGQTYQILLAVDSDNSLSGYPDNGMQAMAVSPIINGFTNTSSIIIAYAATNPYFNEINDWITDIETVVGGSQYFVPLNGGPTLPSQAVTAKQFADSIISQYPKSSFAVTGISLGGYLALAIGAQERIPVVAFVGPDPSNILSTADIAYVQAHPNLYFNIRNMYDVILGAYGGNGLNAAVYYDEGNSGPFYSHTPDYQFNIDGSLIEPASPVWGPIINDIVTAPDSIIAPVVSLLTTALKYSNENIFPIVTPAINTIVSSIQPITTSLTNAVATTVNTANNLISLATTTVTNTISSVTNSIVALLPKWW
ncbi:hypothetical protein [Lactococcus lactis]|uniref:Uncharacterized protein n=1 Tax=Lactococcus lactis TaxID=1358 RepID=A0A3S3PD53_9LACT|nr:hypothetical protein [Lactococcus lactis]KRO24305.1 hypothetical protein IV65_GL000200 [Lactococcus lactis subsp. lactis]MBN2936365.1 hypothetical protein [Lactococcus lactis]NYZ58169.1 hypothetical protein [Lactococcus lactis]RWR48445.1 hypothetical protein EO246_02885 [Lactococcus lactis]UTG79023.1 hypothetical protein MK801_10030 [Lactococcus lactis]